MKLAKITLSVALLGAMTVGMASDFSASNSDLNAQLAKIKQAPVAKRAELMNQFKQQIANMSPADRKLAISKLQNRASSTTKRIQSNAKKFNRTIIRKPGSIFNSAKSSAKLAEQAVREAAQNAQAKSMSFMNQAQNMNQIQNMLQEAQNKASGQSGNSNSNNNNNSGIIPAKPKN